METLATGTIAFLMTDVAGSTAHWERDSDGMLRSLMLHDAIVGDSVAACGGRLVKARGEGDSHFAVFPSPSQAVAAAIRVQRQLQVADWNGGPVLRIRASVHVGETSVVDGDFYGPVVNRCARLRAVAHGGQTVLSEAASLLSTQIEAMGVRLRDLGVHRLRDMQRPERIFDVVDPEVPAEEAVPRSLSVLPNNLPVQLTSFVGRAGDLTEIGRLLKTERAVTLLGPGGAGKTRLSLQVAADHSGRFPGGVWFVPLAAVRDLPGIETALATAVRREGGLPGFDAVRECSESGSTLLVLDNCEHILPVLAPAALRLLATAPEVRLLCTSRAPLGIPGEHTVVIPPLEDGRRREILNPDEARSLDAVRLFVDRARSRMPSFYVNEENYRVVLELCQAVDGLPLALEFLASHVYALAPEDLLRRLRDYLRPSTDFSGTDARHRTMEDAIRWSYDSLEPAEQDLFLRLSVLIDGGDLAACEAIGGGPETVPLLRKLVEKSLVTVEEGPGGGRRYRLLQPFRDFAMAFGARERAEAQLAHERYYLQFAQKNGAEVESENQARALDRMDADVENLRMALRTAADGAPNDLPTLTLALRDYWIRRGLLTEAAVWISRSLEVPELPPSTVAMLHNAHGTFLARQGRLNEAREAYRACLATADGIQDARLRAKVGNNLAILHAEAGDSGSARQMYRETCEIFRELGDLGSEATVLSNMGDLETRLGNLDDAITLLGESLMIFEDLGNKAKIARVQYNLAVAHVEKGDWSVAAARLRESLNIWSQVVDPSFMGESLVLLARLCAQDGRDEDAAVLLGASGAVLKDCGTPLQGIERDRERRLSRELVSRLGRAVADKARRKGAAMSAEAAVITALNTLSVSN